jgi:hypothetical protein
LFYLYVLIFKDNKNNPSSWDSIFETLIPSEPYQKEIKFLSDYLSETISGKNFATLPINNFIDLFNSILRKAKFEEISVHLLQGNLGTACKNNISQLLSKKQNNQNNNLLSNSQIINNFGNIPTMDPFVYPNFNNLGMNFNLLTPDNLHPYFSSPNFFSKPNFHFNGNFNNSQINYNQYFQFFNNHNVLNGGHGALHSNPIHAQHPTGSTVNNNFKQVLNNSNLLSQNLNFLNSPISMKQGGGFFHDPLPNFQNPILNAYPQLNGVKLFNPPFNMNINGMAPSNPVNQLNPMNQMSLLNFNIADVKKLNELKSYMEGFYNNSTNIPTNSNYINQTSLENNTEKLQTSAKQLNFNQEKNKTLKIDNLFNDKIEKRNLNLNNYSTLSKQVNKNVSNKSSAPVENINFLNYKFKSPHKNSAEYIKDAYGSIIIVIEKKILSDHPELNISNNSNKSETASLCSEEEREMLRRKRNLDENGSFNENETSKGKESNKKKLRMVTSSSSMYYNWDTPYKSINYNDFNDNDLEMINKINNPRRKKTNKDSNPKISKETYFFSEKSQALKEDLNEFNNIYEAEVGKVLQDKAHIFMKNHFPLMYNLENFYLYLYRYQKERREKNLFVEFKKENENENKIIKSKENTDIILTPEVPENKKLNHDEEAQKSVDHLLSSPLEERPTIELKETNLKKLWDCNHKNDVEGIFLKYI